MPVGATLKESLYIVLHAAFSDGRVIGLKRLSVGLTPAKTPVFTIFQLKVA